MPRTPLEADVAAKPEPGFSEDLRATLMAFRTSLTELLAAVGADPTRPQDVARSFHLNKNLTWKISKLVTAEDLFEVVPRVPGTGAMRIFLKAMSRAGAPADLIERTRVAAADFDAMVERHTDDRATLEIMVQQMLPAHARSDQLEQNRKLAFTGLSGMLGVRARLQFMLAVLAPSPVDRGRADLVNIHGLVDFRRLRTDARWLLSRRERWDDEHAHADPDEVESLDPDFPADQGTPLLGDFCSRPIPHIDVLRLPGEDQYELPPGPVGNTAAFTCVHGHIARRVGEVVASAPGEFAEIGCNLITPAQDFQFDLLVHRSFDWAMTPEALVYSRLDGGSLHGPSRCDRNLLPVAERVHDLGFGATTLATPLFAPYAQLVRYGFERTRLNADEFRVFRFRMAYPPIPAAVMLRAPLPVPA